MICGEDYPCIKDIKKSLKPKRKEIESLAKGDILDIRKFPHPFICLENSSEKINFAGRGEGEETYYITYNKVGSPDKGCKCHTFVFPDQNYINLNKILNENKI